MSQAWFVGIHIRQKGWDPDSIDLLVAFPQVSPRAWRCCVRPCPATKHRSIRSRRTMAVEVSYHGCSMDFPFNSMFGWSWLLGYLGCCHIVSQWLLEFVGQCCDPWAKTKKTSKILEPCPHDFPLFLTQPMEFSSRWMGKVFNYQRGTNHYQSMFNGEFPSDFARSCCRVCRRWKYRTVMRCGELGSRLGLSNAKFGDRMWPHIQWLLIPRIHWSMPQKRLLK